MYSSASHNRRANEDWSLGSSCSGSSMLDTNSLVGGWLLAWLVGWSYEVSLVDEFSLTRFCLTCSIARERSARIRLWRGLREIPWRVLVCTA